MKAFLAVSVAPGLASGQHARAIALLHADAVATAPTAGDGWLAYTPSDDEDIFSDPARGVTVRLTRSTRIRSTDLGAPTIAAMLGTGIVASGWLDELLDRRRSAHASTIAFLVNLIAAADAISAGTRAPAVTGGTR